jgi:signal transduction histidine kinase
VTKKSAESYLLEAPICAKAVARLRSKGWRTGCEIRTDNPTDPHIEVDASQLNQLLLNLCVNARDAMGDTGTLQLSTMLSAEISCETNFPKLKIVTMSVLRLKIQGTEWMKTFESISSNRSLRRNRKVREPALGFRLFTAPS